ncbi:MAG: 5-oxoprolinase subunit PxpA [Gammaproteobacteria bacterium]|nr:5-oxoprolinase subunit PxpA [Gammaproteobacteria bacterium]
MKINCDMGESFGRWTLGQDAQVMPHIDMASIACGMHASDPLVMSETVALAKRHQVTIGAHPGYNDLQGFGRRHIALSKAELSALFLYQLGALSALCESQNTTMEYVKPHGALYNTMMQEDDVFITLLAALQGFDESLPFVVMATPDTEHYIKLAKRYNVLLYFEAFVDRAYDKNGRLVSRAMKGATFIDLKKIQQQALQLIETQSVTTLHGDIIAVHADTLCIHGDSPLAVQAASWLRQAIDSR